MSGGGGERRNPAEAGLEVAARLFNHRPFLQGEIRNFLKDFEEKRQDREVENIFSVLERVSELRDFGVPRLLGNLSNTCTDIVANLQLAGTLADSILETGHTEEIENTLRLSRECRERELREFSAENRLRCERIDQDFKAREEELVKKYKDLEKTWK